MFYQFAKFILGIYYRLIFWPKVIGKERLKVPGKAIYICNHFSNNDAILLAVISPRPICFMAKKEVFKLPGFRKVVQWLGAFPVDRSKADLKAIKKAFAVLEEGKVLGIFPEGTRGKPEKMKPFYPGVAMIALRSNAPIIPIAICTPYRPFRRLVIKVGEPLHLSQSDRKISQENVQDATQILYDAVADLKR